MDRDLLRTGNSIVVISPGTGFFTVSPVLAQITKQRMMDSGIGCDLVSLSQPPLHIAPLFLIDCKDEHEEDFYEQPHWINVSYVDCERDSSTFVQGERLQSASAQGVSTGTGSGVGGGSPRLTTQRLDRNHYKWTGLDELNEAAADSGSGGSRNMMGTGGLGGIRGGSRGSLTSAPWENIFTPLPFSSFISGHIAYAAAEAAALKGTQNSALGFERISISKVLAQTLPSSLQGLLAENVTEQSGNGIILVNNTPSLENPVSSHQNQHQSHLESPAANRNYHLSCWGKISFHKELEGRRMASNFDANTKGSSRSSRLYQDGIAASAFGSSSLVGSLEYRLAAEEGGANGVHEMGSHSHARSQSSDLGGSRSYSSLAPAQSSLTSDNPRCSTSRDRMFSIGSRDDYDDVDDGVGNGDNAPHEAKSMSTLGFAGSYASLGVDSTGFPGGSSSKNNRSFNSKLRPDERDASGSRSRSNEVCNRVLSSLAR